MIDEDEAQDAGNPYAPKPLKVRDPLHDLQLLHDLALINARTQRELGPLPASGLPVEPKRKPHLPRREMPASIALSQTEDESMKLRHIAAVSALAAATLACDFEKPAVDYKQNPHPKQRYDIAMTIADAPGPFASMQGLVQYDVVNSECLPPPDSNPGGYNSPVPTEDVPFTLTRVSETEYTGTIYTDMMLDEDYYGRGACHWQLIQARVHMKATGTEGETIFIPSIASDSLLAEQAKTIYFWKGGYPRSSVESFPDFGESSQEKYKSELQNQLFAITLAPRKGTL